MTKSQHQGHTVNELMTHLRLINGGLLMGPVKNALAWVLWNHYRINHHCQAAQPDSPSSHPHTFILSWVNKGQNQGILCLKISHTCFHPLINPSIQTSTVNSFSSHQSTMCCVPDTGLGTRDPVREEDGQDLLLV